MRFVGAILIMGLLLLAGCAVPVVTPTITVRLEVVDEHQGWVQVRVTGVSSLGFTLRWGDAESSYGMSDVVPWEEIYEHFYQAVEGARSGQQLPANYVVELVDGQGQTVDSATIHVDAAVCYISLVEIDGRDVTVKYWGRFGVEYSISWGDQFADHVMVSTQSGSGIATHTYAAAGTYTLGMEEIWAPTQLFFTITVE